MILIYALVQTARNVFRVQRKGELLPHTQGEVSKERNS